MAMNFTALSTLLRTGLPCLQKPLTLLNNCCRKAYHSIIFAKPSILLEKKLSCGILMPASLVVQPSRGMKYMGRVRRRCKDCYFVVRDQRMYVMCKTHPRHKQAVIQKKEKYKWILSHATQSPIRPW